MGRRQTRTVRYTLLLTPMEFDLANRVAQREYRTLPDFIRTQIYKNAEALGLSIHLAGQSTEQCVAISG